jgi:hypothetical protein
VRYTSYVRSILERAARGGVPPEIAEITERLERIEQAVTGRTAAARYHKSAWQESQGGQATPGPPCCTQPGTREAHVKCT